MPTTTTPTRYRVTTPYVTVRVGGSIMPTWKGHAAAWTSLGFHQDVYLPDNTHPDDIARLVRKGMVEKVTPDA